MSLRDIHVSVDLKERARQLRFSEDSRWRAALVAALLALAVALWIRVLPLAPGSKFWLADGAVSALLLTVGVIAAARPASLRISFLALIYIPLATGVVLGGITADRWASAHLATLHESLLPFAILALVLIAPGWSVIGWFFSRNGVRIAVHRDRHRWMRRILSGLAGGAFIVCFLLVSRSVSGLEGIDWDSLPPLPLFMQRLFCALGLRAAGEELFFRGVIFRHLYRGRRMGLWLATGVSLPFNLVIYGVQVPLLGSPESAALAIIGPAVMVLVNSGLCAKDASLVGPVVSNAVFQTAGLLMGLR